MTRSIVRIATIAITLAALAAPTALARPADIQASVDQVAAKAQHEQDRRAIAGRDDATAPAKAQQQHDRRAIAARDAATRPALDRQSAPSTSRADSTTRPPLAGPPTWPVNPQPITSAPAAKVTDGGNGGVNWTTIALGIAGSLLAIGAIAGITGRTRRSGRARIAA